MNQSQLTTITNTLTSRVHAIAAVRFPDPDEKIDGNAEITKSLVHGRPVKLKPFSAIKQIALDKIAHGSYSSDRSFRFEEVFETSPAIAEARRVREAAQRNRESITIKLDALKARILADCKLGKFDVEQGAALDAFEAKAEELFS